MRDPSCVCLLAVPALHCTALFLSFFLSFASCRNTFGFRCRVSQQYGVCGMVWMDGWMDDVGRWVGGWMGGLAKLGRLVDPN